MHAWPAALPQAPHHRFSGVHASGLLDAENRLYPVRTRTYPERRMSFVFRRLTVAQFQTFRGWWDETLNQCAPFTAPWLAAAGYSHHCCQLDAEQPWEVAMEGRHLHLTITALIIAGVPMDGGNVAYWVGN